MSTRSFLVALLGGLAIVTAHPLDQRDQEPLKPSSPVSNVKGLSFNRFVDIWLENIVSSPTPTTPQQQ